MAGRWVGFRARAEKPVTFLAVAWHTPALPCPGKWPIRVNEWPGPGFGTCSRSDEPIATGALILKTAPRSEDKRL